MAAPKPTSKTLAGQRLRNEREAAGLSQKDLARFYRGGVSQFRICQIETGKGANSKQVEADFMQAIGCAVAAAVATKNTANKCNEQFAVLQNKVAESQERKEWRAMPNMPACSAYLAQCSPTALQSFALARMAQDQ